MITIKNIIETQLILKVDGVVIDDCVLADGNPNIRVIDFNIEIGQLISVNEFEHIVGNESEILFNFETQQFYTEQ
jgi:hypothetical protein